jgi:hypothetical protein
VRARRIDRVRVATSQGVVDITWSDRGELLKRLAEIAGSEDLIAGIEHAGTSRPVRLSKERAARLLGALDFWAEEIGGVENLPPGVAKLLAILTAQIE